METFMNLLFELNKNFPPEPAAIPYQTQMTRFQIMKMITVTNKALYGYTMLTGIKNIWYKIYASMLAAVPFK